MSIGTQPTESDTRFFEASLNGRAARAYVDLGSECVTIRRSDAGKLMLKVEPTEHVLRGYGGAVVRPCAEAA